VTYSVGDAVTPLLRWIAASRRLHTN